MKLGTHVYFSVSMTTTNKNGLGHFSLQLLLHFSKLQTIQYMKVKNGTNEYFSISMATPQAHFSITTSSLLKFANYIMHGSETWYASALECFQDEKNWFRTLLYITILVRTHYFATLNGNTEKHMQGRDVFFSVSMTLYI